MVEILLAVIIVMLGIISTLLGVFGNRITIRVDDHGKRIAKIESHHFRLTGEDLTS
jgi:hypothetical protein